MASLFARPEPPRSLVGRTLLAAVGALLLVMALIGGAIATWLTLRPEPFSWEGPESQEASVEKAMHFDAHGRLTFIEMPARLAEAYDVLSKDMAFQVLDANGAEVFTSPPGPALEALRQVPVQAARHMTHTTEGAVELQVLSTPIERNGARYLLRDARSGRLASGIRSSGSAIVYGAGAATTLLAVLVFSSIVLWRVRRAVKPLREASAAAAAIAPNNLTQRVTGSRLPSELAPLITAFNSALERLELGYRVQQEFLASAAHELKTPLALIRAEIELGDGTNRALLLKDVDFMALQVDQLLQLAEVSELRNFQFAPLDVHDALEEAMAYAGRFADAKGVRLQLVVDDAPRSLDADAGALATLLKNLIENAVHHSASGDVVTLRLGRAGISVRDVGPGVAPADVPRLFTRFWRSETAPHQGAGLGLSICQGIANAHGWSLGYHAPDAGPGAEFRLTFQACGWRRACRSRGTPRRSGRRLEGPPAGARRRRPRPILVTGPCHRPLSPIVEPVRHARRRTAIVVMATLLRARFAIADLLLRTLRRRRRHLPAPIGLRDLLPRVARDRQRPAHLLSLLSLLRLLCLLRRLPIALRRDLLAHRLRLRLRSLPGRLRARLPGRSLRLELRVAVAVVVAVVLPALGVLLRAPRAIVVGAVVIPTRLLRTLVGPLALLLLLPARLLPTLARDAILFDPLRAAPGALLRRPAAAQHVVAIPAVVDEHHRHAVSAVLVAVARPLRALPVRHPQVDRRLRQRRGIDVFRLDVAVAVVDRDHRLFRVQPRRLDVAADRHAAVDAGLDDHGPRRGAGQSGDCNECESGGGDQGAFHARAPGCGGPCSTRSAWRKLSGLT